MGKAQSKVADENAKTAPVSRSSGGQIEVIDLTGNITNQTDNEESFVQDRQSKCINDKTGYAKSKFQNDKIETSAPNSESSTEMTDFIIDDPFDSRSVGTQTEFIDLTGDVMNQTEKEVSIVPDGESKRMNDKTGNAKTKIQNDKIESSVLNSESSTAMTDFVTDDPVHSRMVQNGNSKEITSERKSLKRKATHPATSEMVMESIKALRKHRGATMENITEYMQEKYVVNINRVKRHVENFLQKSIDDGVLEKIDGGASGERFKIKKSSKNRSQKEGKVTPQKELAAAKKQPEK